MNLKVDIMILILFSLMYLGYQYVFLKDMVEYRLGAKRFRKLSEGQTLKEKIFFLRFKEEIPKLLRILYYFVLFIHFVCFLLYFLITLLELPYTIRIVLLLIFGDTVLFLIIHLLFKGKGRGKYAYERWIRKIKRKK